MPTFSKRSLDNLAQCHPDLQKVAKEAIRHFDFVITTGHRNKADQNKAFASGHSKLQYPHSKHNKKPSLAFDAAPYPIDWEDIARFDEMGKVMKAAAKTVGVKITWGGSWKSFKDRPHFEVG